MKSSSNAILVLLLILGLMSLFLFPSCGKKKKDDPNKGNKKTGGSYYQQPVIPSPQTWNKQYQSLYTDKGLDHPVYVGANHVFTWKVDEESIPGLLFRFSKTKEGLYTEDWRLLDGSGNDFIRLPNEISNGSIWIDFQLTKEFQKNSRIKISTYPK